MMWHGLEDVEPLQNAEDKRLAQAQSTRLYIFYFSDPRSHWVYRKSQYYQEGVRCCLMRFLFKMLSDMLQSPQLLSHIHICPKPKVKLGPTDLIYSAPPSSFDIAIARNPNQFGLTDGISVSPRWACKLSVTCCNHFDLTEICNRSHWVCLTNSLFCLLPKSVSPSLCNRSYQDYVMP